MAETKSIYTKLLAAQKAIKAVEKNKTNPHFKNTYADINEIISEVKPALNDNGLVLLQPLTHLEDGTPALKTIILDSESGEKIEDVTPINHTPRNPQDHGSAVTYFRRYTLQSLLLLEAEDDDGQQASEKAAEEDPVAAQKREIWKRMQAVDSETTKDNIRDKVKAYTNYDLIEENYENIIRVLKAYEGQ